MVVGAKRGGYEMSKIGSGRFLFTLVAAILLFVGTMDGKFNPDKVLDIIKDVVIFYFVVKQAMTANAAPKA